MTKLKSRGEMVGSILGGEFEAGGSEMESPRRLTVRLPASGERGVVLVVVLVVVDGMGAGSSSSSSSD